MNAFDRCFAALQSTGKRPYQDNGTVLLYAPAGGTE